MRNSTSPQVRVSSMLLAVVLAMASTLLIVHSYDPEQQDGIPVLSAHTRTPSRSHSVSLGERLRNNGGHLRRRSHLSPERREWADDAYERDRDDFDHDEYDERGDEEPSPQTGRDPHDAHSSSRHDSYEDPPFGESRNSARDGRDIEHFFEQHLAPEPEVKDNVYQQVPLSQLARLEAGQPEGADQRDRRRRRRRSTSLDYTTGESSPLASIFQTLIAAHRRPLVITTGDDDDTQVTQSSSSIGSGPSTLVGGASNDQSSTGLPVATYLSPMAAPSSMTSYGYPQQQQQKGVDPAPSDQVDSDSQVVQTGDSDGSSASDANSQQVQEIYIARRPSILRHFQAYAPSALAALGAASSASAGAASSMAASLQQQQQQQGESSGNHAAYWRRPTSASGTYTGRQQYQPQQQYFVPSGATRGLLASAAHNTDSNVGGGEAADEEDPGTVVYNLSFGGRPEPSGGGGGSSSSSGSSDDQMGVDEQQGGASDEGPAPVQRLRGLPATPHYHPSVMGSMNHQYYNNLNHPFMAQLYAQQLQQQQHHQAHHNGLQQQQAQQPMAYVRVPLNHPAMLALARQQQQLAAAAANYQNQHQSTRYHRDPTESTSQVSRANQQRRTSLGRHDRTVGPLQTGPAYLSGPRQVTVMRKLKNVDNEADIDEYKSFHSEIDPHRSYMSAMHLVKQPTGSLGVHTGSEESGSTRVAEISPLNHQPSAHNYNLNGQNQTISNITTLGASNDLLREPSASSPSLPVAIRRVKRDDSEQDGDDDDGVWVDDDDDDDNNKQSSDLYETSQDPNDPNSSGVAADSQQDYQQNNNNQQEPSQYHANAIPAGSHHGYELSPEELMVYPG